MTITAAWILSLPALAQASACLYRGTDATARVVQRSGEIITPFPEAKSAQDCSRLRVASGTVSVYVLSADRAAIATRQVTEDGGPLVQTSTANKDAGNGESFSLVKQILVVLEGGQRIKNGSSRGAEGDYVVAALPSGKLGQPTVDLVIPLGPSPDVNLGGFELLVDGRLAHRQTGASSSLTLPAMTLRPGAKVLWKLNYSGERLEGSFEVVSAARVAALKSTLARESEIGTDPKVAELRIASGLLLEGFGWDARELIRAAVAP